VTVAAKSGQFTADEAGKSQFLRGNRRYLAEEGVARRISSPREVAGVPNLFLMTEASGLEHGYRGVVERT